MMKIEKNCCCYNKMQIKVIVKKNNKKLIV